MDGLKARFRWSRFDAGVVVTVMLAGLFFWLVFLAVQPRDYSLPFGSPKRLRTIFGWRALGIDPKDLIERNRMQAAFAGWFVVGLVAGRLRPRLWMLFGPLTVLPALLLYFPTAPHDAQGYWVLDVVFLPLVALGVSGAAKLAPKLDWVVSNPLVLAGGTGVLFAIALLSGGGESNPAIIGSGLGSAFLVGIVAFGKRALTPPR